MDAEHISKYEAAAMYAYENTTAQTEVTKERNYLSSAPQVFVPVIRKRQS